jgi:hypothetical protein
MAAAVAGFGMMAAGSATAADKGNGPDKYVSMAPPCPVVQDSSFYRKCGDTGSAHEARAEPQRTREPEQPPADNEPVGAAAPQND